MNISDVLIFVLEMIGTVAFASSGALTGIRKNMDIFGICVLGITTAVGGGIIRDLAWHSSAKDFSESSLRDDFHCNIVYVVSDCLF